MQYKISFIVPLYNKAPYIADCLNSLLAQKYKDIEIVIVNDRSTDNVEDILDYYKEQDKRIRLYNLPKNMGRSYARNYGNAKATGDILCVQDADDASVIERAGLTVKHFKKYPKDDVFYSGFYVTDFRLEPVQTVVAQPIDLDKIKDTKFTYICHSTMAYRKEVVSKVNYSEGVYSKLGIDDWKLQLDLIKKGYKFGLNANPLVFYRQVGNSISVNRDENKVNKAKMKYMKELGV